MDKKIMRNVLNGLEVGQVVNLNFVGENRNLSGEYRFLETRRGRGKGGSLLAEFAPVNGTGDHVVVGTPANGEVLNMVVDNVVYGYRNENEVPLIFDTNAAVAAELKEAFKVFMNDGACPKNVLVESEVEALSGEFTVTGARQLRGRGGQVVLETQDGVELWSGRHSGVIRTFQVK